MSLSECICSASKSSNFVADEGYGEGSGGARQCINSLPDLNGMQSSRTGKCADKANLIDSLRFLVETSKQHFNPKYRLRGMQFPFVV